jgi:hypothetical protein
MDNLLSRRSALGAIAALAGSIGFPQRLPAAEAAATKSRDPWLWPFSTDSIWNRPIGDAARYQPAQLQPAAHVGVDTQFLVRVLASDPLRDVLGSRSFDSRVTGAGPLEFQLPIPDSYVVPDCGPNNPYGLTPNANFALLMPDGDTLLQGCALCRPQAGGPIYLPEWMKYPDNRKTSRLRGNGLDGGGQGASGMSALGGTIRRGELTGDEPIRHAIKLNPWAAKYCHYSEKHPGYRWPAKSADGYAAQLYKGTNRALVMGSLLAIPPSMSLRNLKLQTQPGKKLFQVLQDYGAYFTEDAAWDTWDLIVERDAEQEFTDQYGFSMSSEAWKNDVNLLVQALAIVDNNGPKTIGGGGKPRQPLAPPFAKP